MPPGIAPALLEGGEDLVQDLSVPRCLRCRPLQVDIQVAHISQCAREEAQVSLVTLGLPGQELSVEFQGGPQAAGSDAHVVQFLRVLAETDTELASQHRGEVAAKDREGDLTGQHRGIYLRRPEIRPDCRLESGGAEPRFELEVAVGRSSSEDRSQPTKPATSS